MSVDGSTTNSAEIAALHKYRKGMKDVGRSLLVLAVLQLAFAGIVLAIKFEPIILTILVVMAVMHLVMGLLILRQQGWANYLVATWATLILAANCIWMGLQGALQK